MFNFGKEESGTKVIICEQCGVVVSKEKAVVRKSVDGTKTKYFCKQHEPNWDLFEDTIEFSWDYFPWNEPQYFKIVAVSKDGTPKKHFSSLLELLEEHTPSETKESSKKSKKRNTKKTK